MRYIFPPTLLIALMLGLLCNDVVAQSKPCQLQVEVSSDIDDDWSVTFNLELNHAAVVLENVASGENKSPSVTRGTIATFSNLVPGQYMIIVTAAGYKRTLKKINITCAYPVYRIDVKIYEGRASETINLGVSTPDPIIKTPSPSRRTASSAEQEAALEDERILKSKEAPSPAKPRASSQTLFPKEDPGIDLAVVIASKANLRERADISSEVVQELERGNLLALIDRTPINSWYNVIHVRSGKEGWIKQNLVDVKYTQKPRPAPIFEERRVASDRNPELIIENGTDRILSLRLGEKLLTIAPNSQQTVSVPPGNYRFYGSVPNALPTFGEREFPKGIIFTWRFYIVRR